MRLWICACGRHVRSADARCPFCSNRRPAARVVIGAIVGAAVGVACGARTDLGKPVHVVDAGAGDASTKDVSVVDAFAVDAPLDSPFTSDVVEECLPYGAVCTVWSDCCGSFCDNGHVCSPAPLYGAPPPPDD
jgi:hypothetical protein